MAQQRPRAMSVAIPSCIGDHLNCPVCLDPFQDPKVLNCLHSFCSKCLHKIWQKQLDVRQEQQHISCPVCRKVSLLPSEGIAGLPDNFLINNLLGSMQLTEQPSPAPVGRLNAKTRQSWSGAFAASLPAQLPSPGAKLGPTKCGNCGEKSIEFCCLDCNIALCSPCAHVHRKQLTTRSHTTRHLDGLSTSFEPSLLHSGPHLCGEHPDEVLKLYCRPCKQCICRDCALLAHRDHEYVFLKDIVEEKKQHLETLIADGEQVMEQLHQATRHLQHSMDELQQSADETATAIRHFIDKHLQAIEQRRDQLLHEVNAQLRVRLKGHRIAHAELEAKMRTTSQMLQVSQSVMEHGSPWDMVDMCQEIDLESLMPELGQASHGKEIASMAVVNALVISWQVLAR